MRTRKHKGSIFSGDGPSETYNLATLTKEVCKSWKGILHPNVAVFINYFVMVDWVENLGKVSKVRPQRPCVFLSCDRQI